MHLTRQKTRRFQPAKVALLIGSSLSILAAPAAFAQDSEDGDVVIATGIRQSLANALSEKRQSASLVEVILAEDIGKLPDQNLAEVLENLPGIQITRTAGVGTGVQIRGTTDNRVEINGVATVGSGSGRSGISFEDVPAAMIAGVEVTKAPTAKTIEGGIGGTINLRTIRPLDLDEGDLLANVRIQGEDSSLSTDGITPRLSGTLGKKWSNPKGQEIGAVVSLSYSEQDVTAFRPRADRDNDSVADLYNAGTEGDLPLYIAPQFFVQDYDNFEYETLNVSASFEARPSDNVKLYLDVMANDQQRLQESSRVQASGISAGDLAQNIDNISTFETIDFGSLNGQELGTIDVATSGIVPVQDDGTDGNLRFSSDTNSRLTDSRVLRLGTELDFGKLSGVVEYSNSTSSSTTPSFNTTLNFINPNVATNDTNENGTPFIYDLTGGSLTFAVLQDAAYGGPTTEQLLDPANVVLRDVNIGNNSVENSDQAFRLDASYDTSDSFGGILSSVDAGYRFNKNSSVSDEVNTRIGLRTAADSPTGDLFASLLTAGPDNFGDADGRELFVENFLLIDAEQVASDPAGALATLNAAILAHGGSTTLDALSSDAEAFFDISEETHSLYGQANFDFGLFRANAGVRYVQTDVASTGNTIVNGVATPTTTKGSYDYLLPRVNLVADVTDSIVLRGSYGKDISRPAFDDLSTAISFGTSPNTSVSIGNPGLLPQEVESFDVSADWYFAPAAVFSAGYFRKKRTGLFSTIEEDVATTAVTDSGGFNVDVRDITDPCEGGGIFNPIADQNVFAPLDANGDQTSGVGVCVPTVQVINGTGDEIQEGFEFSFQYDLSSFEDRIGFASGFGIQANYTHQTFDSSGSETNSATSRARDIFLAASGATDVERDITLIDLSEDAYNATIYYEKYGISARARYTWRSEYRSDDFGSTSSFPFGFPVVQEARGQLNAGINYDVTDHLNIGVEGVNLTESDVTQSCVNSGAVTCFQGLTDRRVLFGASYTF